MIVWDDVLQDIKSRTWRLNPNPPMPVPGCQIFKKDYDKFLDDVYVYIESLVK